MSNETDTIDTEELLDDEDEIVDDEEIEEEEEPEKIAEPPPTRIEIAVADDKPRKSKKKAEPKEILPKDFDQYIDALAPGSDSGIYLTVTRAQPVLFKGKDISGYLNRFDEPVTSQQIKELYGGGTYDVMIMGPRKKKDGTVGGNTLLSKRRLKISGDPKPETSDSGDPISRQHSDPDIVQQTLSAQQEMIKHSQEEKKAAGEKQDRLLEAIISKKDDGGNKSLESMLKLMQATLESQKATAEAQIIAAREDARLARQQLEDSRRESREEMRRLREDMDKKEERAMNPLVELMRESAKESAVRNEAMMKQMTELAKINQSSSEKSYQTQLELMKESGKQRDEFLMTQLKNTMEELKDARKSQSGTLLDKLKEFKTIKSVFGEESPERDLVDRVTEMLPEVPSIIQSFGYLFGKAPPVQQQAVQQPVAQLPPGPQQQAQPTPTPLPNDDRKREQMKLAITIKKFTEEAEKAIKDGKDPESFANEAVIGNFDEEILRKIAAHPSAALVTAIRSSIQSDDSVLNTPAGKQFLNKVHEVVKRRYS